MPESTKQAKAEVATVEDYDSDESRAVDGTARHASQLGVQQSSSSSSRRPSQPRKSHRDSRPDAGHTSRTTKDPVQLVHTATASNRPAVPQPAATTPTEPLSSNQGAAGRSKSSKPVIHRNDSGRTSARADQPASAKHTACTDKYCCDPDCDRSRRKERRQTLVHLPQQQLATQQYPVVHQYCQPAQYQYSAVHDPAGMPPRQRPMSVYGYAIPSQPPPHHASYAQPQMYANQSPTANVGAVYQPASSVQVSSTSPTYPGYPTQTSNTTTYSARQINPTLPGLGPPKIVPLVVAERPVSARRTEGRRYHEQPVQYSSESEYTSETDYYSEEDDRPPQRRSSHRRRPSDRDVAIVAHPSRPVVKKYLIEDRTQSTRKPREARLHPPRQRRSDSDVGDSDRTARAVVDRPSYSGTSSRRPSIATTSSSGSRRETNLSSSNTDYSSHVARMVVEGKHGRRSAYLAKDLRHQQNLREDEDAARRMRETVDAYQRSMQGNLDPYELTAENMRRTGDHRRRSNSYISSKSHRSSTSQGGGGIKIQSGDTVMHVYGDAKVEMRAGENGEPASFVIAGAGDAGGSHRSSRSGRERSDTRPRVIREENSFDDGYEVGR